MIIVHYERCSAGGIAPAPLLDGLPQSEATEGRCAICAYDRGRHHAVAGVPPLIGTGDGCTHDSQVHVDALRALHTTPAGEGRRKCVVCAYDAGYRSAQRVRRT
ncbi:MAG: hypothetical protein ACI8PZ_002635 [Myxococcota bacterium]|jgi:hypothetical protein